MNAQMDFLSDIFEDHLLTWYRNDKGFAQADADGRTYVIKPAWKYERKPVPDGFNAVLPTGKRVWAPTIRLAKQAAQTFENRLHLDFSLSDRDNADAVLREFRTMKACEPEGVLFLEWVTGWVALDEDAATVAAVTGLPVEAHRMARNEERVKMVELDSAAANRAFEKLASAGMPVRVGQRVPTVAGWQRRVSLWQP